MTRSIFIIFGLSIFLCTQCSDEQCDYLCTTEFRTYLVTVIDTLGNPVDSLHTKVINSRGKEFNFDGITPPPNLVGKYLVMADRYKKDFTTRQESVIFTGNKNGHEVSAKFFFNTDECRCHVYKVFGPDTLVLK